METRDTRNLSLRADVVHCKTGHFTPWKERESLRIVQNIKIARSKRAKLLCFIVKYAN